MLEEADKHCKSAEKKLKKSFFGKWSIGQSDYDVAAMEYERAAKIYQLAQRHEQAIHTWELSAENFAKADLPFNQGRAFESVASIYKDTKDDSKQVEYLKKAGEAYLEDSKPDKCADAYGRAARVLRDSNPSAASELVKKALDMLYDNEQFHFMPELGRLLVAINTKAGDFLEAAASVKLNMRHFEALSQTHNFSKAAMELVVLHLARFDEIIAERDYNDMLGKCGLDPTESQICEDLIEAFKNCDAEFLADVLTRQPLTFIHPDIARLAKKLRLKEGAAKPKAPQPGAPPAAEAEDDDDWT
eukprot:TRINITY_DN57870_c0_g1_i1.p1 TRINITY_DN57870_c0_g1~~TRINITY_DN57870_c0_g1_i1.p1  ORF type:complete len:332 (+),score=109.76 TRINITY_DN57870_c0_g1_i1:91-996(+)